MTGTNETTRSQSTPSRGITTATSTAARPTRVTRPTLRDYRQAHARALAFYLDARARFSQLPLETAREMAERETLASGHCDGLPVGWRESVLRVGDAQANGNRA